MIVTPEKEATYRTAVDLTLTLFNIKQNRQLFLVVVPKFFFWSDNSHAASLVMQDTSEKMFLHKLARLYKLRVM
jgi:hypothetical protein